TALSLAQPEVSDGEIRAEVLDFNRFGNIQLNVREADLGQAGLADVKCLTIRAVSASAEARRGNTYADFQPREYGVLFYQRGWLPTVPRNPQTALPRLPPPP